MKAEKENHLWLAIICFILAGLVETGYATAQDKPPSPPPVNNQVIKSTGGSGMDKPPTPPPQGVETDQSLPAESADMAPPTIPLSTGGTGEPGEATSDTVNTLPPSRVKTRHRIQTAPSANAPKPTYEIKLKEGGSPSHKPVPQKSISR